MGNNSRKILKSYTVLMILVIMGSFLANVNIKASFITKRQNKIENVCPIDETISDYNYELDFTSLKEISEFFSAHAKLNNYKLTTTVYSAGLLYETENSLIIIGHGHFNSQGDYYIADYSADTISKYAKDKEFVALIACYSANIELENKIQLSYTTTIDLESSINDLMDLLQWKEKYSFCPLKNINLIELDPGGGGNGGEDANFPWDGLRYAYTGYDGGTYWNIWYSSAQTSLKNFMLSHLGIKVQLTMSGDFLMDPGNGQYVMDYQVITYDCWIYRNSDMNLYMHFENVKNNGVNLGKFLDVKYNDMTSIYTTQGYTPFITMTVLLCTLLFEVGIAFLIPLGSALVKGTTWASIAGLIKLMALIGVILIAAALIIGIVVWAITITWI